MMNLPQPPPPPLAQPPAAAVASHAWGGWGGAMVIPLLFHASLWAVLCVAPALRAGCGVLVEYSMC